MTIYTSSIEPLACSSCPPHEASPEPSPARTQSPRNRRLFLLLLLLLLLVIIFIDLVLGVPLGVVLVQDTLPLLAEHLLQREHPGLPLLAVRVHRRQAIHELLRVPGPVFLRQVLHDGRVVVLGCLPRLPALDEVVDLPLAREQ
ncbi:hypothetical protein BRADI_3g41611v3 [Brachypodium distachyon]|uniref:Uncharacterized protein n=1 Tax=Brachypodium distachyon TaxID=15368 RepID=A0A2K2D2K0_BRADI|nr:hypothetical protein BRADI_3g41611v3 [Brachypodium distachyon]